MMSRKAPFGQLEQYIIRIPDHLRKELDLQTGERLYLKTTDNDRLLLTVYPALELDEWYDSESAFVVKRIFDKVNIKNKKKTTGGLQLIEGGVSLGCDPEFLVVDVKDNVAVKAYPLIGGGTYDKLGSDDGRVEIRPDPAMDEFRLVENMKALLTQARKKITDLQEGAALRKSTAWYVGREFKFEGMSAKKNFKDELWACGFHLHFGLHPKLRGKQNNYAAVRAFLASTIMVLDYFVAVPAVVPEGTADCYRRAIHKKYGKPGDFKHNKLFTLEYRVPGGHHMRSPALTRGLIGISALVVEDIMTKAQEVTKGFTKLSMLSRYELMKGIYPQLPDYKLLKSALTSKDVDLAKELSYGIQPQLEGMLTYNKHKPSVVPFFDHILGGKQTSANIEENWSIV